MLALLALALAPLAASPGPERRPVAVYLEPIREGVVRGVAIEKVESTIRERLAKEKDLVLVRDDEDATIVLEVTECATWDETRVTRDVDGRDVFIPTEGGGMARGEEGAYGVRHESRSHVVLAVQARWPDRTEDLRSEKDERYLKDAAKSVVARLVRLVRQPR